MSDHVEKDFQVVMKEAEEDLYSVGQVLHRLSTCASVRGLVLSILSGRDQLHRNYDFQIPGLMRLVSFTKRFRRKLTSEFGSRLNKNAARQDRATCTSLDSSMNTRTTFSMKRQSLAACLDRADGSG